jgi:hypothetical protein
MPRSIKRPQVGHIVWYFANPAPAAPLAALVCSTVTWSDATETGTFNLFVLSASAVSSAVLGVAFTQAGGVYQQVTAAVIAAGGASYVIGDRITLSNGVVVQVATVSAGAILTVTIVNPGSSVTASPPANPVAQVSTTGAGTGATFTLTWSSGAWCTYPRAFESTSQLQPAMFGEAAPQQPPPSDKGDDEEEFGEDNGDDEEEEPSSRERTVSRTTTRSRTATPSHRGAHR